MSDQIIIVCDDEGSPTGEYIPKEVGHTGRGRRHLAITVLLYHKGEVLLQKRKHKIFDNIWDFTASTHPLHTDRGDETFEEASLRALKDEYGIKKVDVNALGSFNYFTQIGDLCENEHCAMMVGEYGGGIKMDPKVGYEYKWVDKKEFLKDVKSNPQNYAPWVIEGIKVLKQGF